MKRNHNKARFKQIAALALGIASLGLSAPKVNASVTEATTQSQSKKDVIQVKHAPVRPVSKVNDLFGTGDANPYKHHRRGVGNQRQMRKRWRQSPNSRPAKNRTI